MPTITTDLWESYNGKGFASEYAKVAKYDSEGNAISQQFADINNAVSEVDTRVTSVEGKIPSGTNSTDNQLVNVSGVSSAVTTALANYTASYNQQTGVLSLNFGGNSSS